MADSTYSLNPWIEYWLKHRFIYGIPAPIWVTYVDVIEGYINAQKLRPVAPEVYEGLIASAALPAAASREAVALFPKIPFPGGIRLPHFHFKGQLYMLNSDQWKGFSDRIVKEFQAKLADGHKLNFEQVLDVSEAVSGIA